MCFAPHCRLVTVKELRMHVMQCIYHKWQRNWHFEQLCAHSTGKCIPKCFHSQTQPLLSAVNAAARTLHMRLLCKCPSLVQKGFLENVNWQRKKAAPPQLCTHVLSNAFHKLNSFSSSKIFACVTATTSRPSATQASPRASVFILLHCTA